MKKNSPGHFDKFAKKKSNAAIKEQFKQDKRKWKKEREDFFEKKKLEGRGRKPEPFAKSTSNLSKGIHSDNTQASTQEMPLNKFIAHCGICSRRSFLDARL